ncbi:MAG: phosphatidylserine/phosphatidylglycerophosphate/cardiolipin synthase-like enzyme [Polyangiales bacterium]|jgi:phosphatidylserine/phosphatidylglycerophosphate/cardiolipin synthase-like enzyme
MTSNGPFASLERVRQSLAALMSPQGDGDLVESARSLTSMLDRWTRNPTLRRLFGGVQRDVVTARGDNIELSASIPAPLRSAASARFYAGEVLLGEETLHGNAEVHIVRAAPSAGLHRIRVDVVDRDGRVIAALPGRRVVQVTGATPVALVHADLFLEGAPDATLSALRELSGDAFELVYFDIHEKNRQSLIDAAVDRHRLPPGAIIVYSAQEQELESLGLDFVRMFALTAVRRMRANGVPVSTILTGRHVDGAEAKSAFLTATTPEEAHARMLRGELHVEHEFAADLLAKRSKTSVIDWRLDQMTTSSRVDGNACHAEFDNHKARESLFDAIDGATASVHLQVYIVQPSQFAESLVVKLIRRARSGVRVRFMVDALYSEERILGRLNPLIQSLRDEPNIEVLALQPIASPNDVDVAHLKKRDHRKLVIIDDELAFVSGRNFGDEYFTGFDEVPVHDHTPHERIPWLDAHVELRGPLVRAVQDTFVETWQAHGGTFIESGRGLSPHTPASPSPASPSPASPSPASPSPASPSPASPSPASPSPAPQGGKTTARLVVHHGFADMNGLAMYEALFDSAQSHAYIVNDFPFVPALENAIRRLAARGVQVKLLTGNASARRDDGSFFPAPVHRTAFEYMVKAKLEPLIDAGVEVYEFRPPPSPTVVARGGRIRPYVHAKLVSIDGIATSIGSANLDGTASYWESEANIVVQDAEFATGVEATLERMITAGFRLDVESEYWKRERAQRAVAAALWPGMFYS